MKCRFVSPVRKFELVPGPADDSASYGGAGGDEPQGTETFIDGGGI
jgi:hypothetical protein